MKILILSVLIGFSSCFLVPKIDISLFTKRFLNQQSVTISDSFAFDFALYNYDPARNSPSYANVSGTTYLDASRNTVKQVLNQTENGKLNFIVTVTDYNTEVESIYLPDYSYCIK